MDIKQKSLPKKRIQKQADLSKGKPQLLLSIITPAFNEGAIIRQNLERLYRYMEKSDPSRQWEMIIINDGSKDNTGELAEQFAKNRDNIIVHHNIVNLNLGRALQTGFALARGQYVVVMDIDLTYSEDHIHQLLGKIIETDADCVLASPYMKGGKSTAVPFFRLLLSKVVNRMMRIMSPIKVHTFTGMVRIYKAEFLKKLNLKSTTYSINPEIIYKGAILRARIEEIPAHLDWSDQKQTSRSSSIRIFRGIMAGLMSGFIFRPYFFFMGIGLFLFIVASYIIVWIFIHTFTVLPEIATANIDFETRFGMAVAQVFTERPYSFLVGGVSLIISFQFLGIGFLSLQSKRYFEELYHFHTRMLEENRH